jgi:hypothetical protein
MIAGLSNNTVHLSRLLYCSSIRECVLVRMDVAGLTFSCRRWIFGFSTFGLSRIYRVVALESRLSVTGLLLHGTTDFNINEGLVNKANFTGNLILASRVSRPIDIIGRMEAEVGGKYLPNLVIVSSRIV